MIFYHLTCAAATAEDAETETCFEDRQRDRDRDRQRDRDRRRVRGRDRRMTERYRKFVTCRCHNNEMQPKELQND